MDEQAEQASPTITLTTPTPAFPAYPALESPPSQPPAENYTMDDYTNSPDGGVGVPLDMEVLHDFGEGVGVDMRDFQHSKEELVDHDQLSTPQLQQAPITPHMTIPSSAGMHSAVTAVNVDDMFQTETGLDGDDDDDDEDEAAPKKRNKYNDVPGGFTYVDKDGESGRRKIRIEYITDKSRRHITFSKRKAGIMKKAYELSILTGTQVLLLVVSETGLVYTFTTTKLQPLVQKPDGKNLIQACLNAPDGFGPDGQPTSGPVPTTKAKNGQLAIRPHKLTAAASAAMAASAQQAAASNIPLDGMSTPNDQQASAAGMIGQGTPATGRPKKRLPSGKRKGGPNSNPDLSQPSDIPPVPSLPDMHRQPSPHGMGMTLQSPMTANYPYPSPHHPEYHNLHHQQQHHQQQQQQQQQQHHQHHHPGHHLSSAGPSPTQASFGFTPNGDYSYYPTQPQQQQQQQGNGYLGIGGQGLASPYGHTGHPGQGHSPGGGPPREGDRRMMSMGM